MNETRSSRRFDHAEPISQAFTLSAIVGALLLIVLVHIGFYPTYLRHFPAFDGFRYVQHFHGAMMMGWLLMLLAQPAFIRAGRYDLHRLLGTASYILAPLVLVSMYLITGFRYDGIARTAGQAAAVAHLALNAPNIAFFAVLYLLAIVYKRRTALHMRFMCSTAFVVVGPGLARVLIGYLGYSLADAVMVVRIATPLVTGVLAVGDSVRTKRMSPFTVVFGFMVLHTILWNAREGRLWQSIGTALAGLLWRTTAG